MADQPMATLWWYTIVQFSGHQIDDVIKEP